VSPFAFDNSNYLNSSIQTVTFRQRVAT